MTICSAGTARGGRPDARSSARRYADKRQLRARRRTLPFFCQKLLQGRLVQYRLRQQLLQLSVLFLQRPQPLGVRYFHAAVFGLPIIQRGFHTGVVLPQNAVICSSVNLFRFIVVPFGRPDANSAWSKNSGLRQYTVRPGHLCQPYFQSCRLARLGSSSQSLTQRKRQGVCGLFFIDLNQRTAPHHVQGVTGGHQSGALAPQPGDPTASKG